MLDYRELRHRQVRLAREKKEMEHKVLISASLCCCHGCTLFDDFPSPAGG